MQQDLTFRDLFPLDDKVLRARLEIGMKLNPTVEHVQREVRKYSKSIRSSWIQKALMERSANLLDFDVLNVLLEAWKKYLDIEKDIENTRNNPAEVAFVDLVTHSVSSQHHPYVEILVGGQPVERFTFDVSFSMTLQGFRLRIEKGAVNGVESGRAKGEASLSYSGVLLEHFETREIPFPGHIEFSAPSTSFRATA